MKTIHARDPSSPALLPVSAGLLFLLWSRSFISSETAQAAFLVIGAAHVSSQIAGAPDLWRTRKGSLLPAIFLGAFAWLAAGIATAVALSHHR